MGKEFIRRVKVIYNILLFNQFETLDAFGPIEVLGRLDNAEIHYCSLLGGDVVSAQGTHIVTESIDTADQSGILVLPGGQGTRSLVEDKDFLLTLFNLAQKAEWVLSICTGSALLAKCGLLDGLKATSNKRSFGWVTSCSENTFWQSRARWVHDDKFYTASGISAGIDMTLGFIQDRYSLETAQAICKRIEYIWNQDPQQDPFEVSLL